jgi:ABC-type multidrug transport system fused ATPase/permease subunit
MGNLDILTDFVGDHSYEFLSYMLVVMLIYPTKGVLLPIILGKLINGLSVGTTLTNKNSWIRQLLSGNVLGIIQLLAIVWVLILIFTWVKRNIEADLIPEFISYIRRRVYSGTLNRGSEEFAHIQSGGYLSRVFEIARNYKDLLQYTLSKLIPNMVIVISITAFLLIKNRAVGAILLTGFIAIGILGYFATKYLLTLISEREDFFHKNISEELQDRIDNLLNIYINNETQNEIDRNAAFEAQNIKLSKYVWKVETIYINLARIVLIIMLISALMYLYNDAIRDGKSNVWLWMLLLFELMQISWEQVEGYIESVVYKLGVLLSSDLDVGLSNQDSTDPDSTDQEVHSKEIVGHLEFKGVYYKYPSSSQNLFENLNFSIAPGEKVMLKGRSGSGKSTLMRMLIGINKPDRGEITIDGRPLSSYDKKSLRKFIKYENQETMLLSGTLLSNVVYGSGVSEEKVLSKIERYGLSSVYSGLSLGVNTEVGVHGRGLSGGMQKVSMLLRAVLSESRVLVLDEPLAGLDENTKSKVIEMIMEESGGKTLIVISHDEAIGRFMNRVVDIGKLNRV